LADVSDEDMERLASRLAMLVSQDGEAEAAGRAVSHLMRRLGMTGGQLKEMFLAGASGRPAAHPPPPPHAARPADIERLEREIAALRRGAREAENELRNTEREREMLGSEVERLRSALFRVQTISHAERIIGGIVLVAVLIAAAVGYIVPFGRSPAAPPAPVADAMQFPSGPLPGDQQPDVRRIATVRSAHTLVHAEPDQASRVVASLTPGSSLVVHRVFWNMLYQWAEVEVASGIGFVVTTDITISESH
jgi:hypothetical protein